MSGRKFNRDTGSRKALLRSLASALVREGHVTTTAAKGKTLHSLADRLVTIAKGSDQLQARRQLQAFFGKRDAANVMVDRIVPLHTDRTSGYTTLSVVGVRAGDNAQMVEVKWINMPTVTGTFANPNPAPKNERTTKRAAAVKTAKATKGGKIAKTATPKSKTVATKTTTPTKPAIKAKPAKPAKPAKSVKAAPVAKSATKAKPKSKASAAKK
jgi:large subunit ribosomal protein L17